MPKVYDCECGKQFQCPSGLWKHRQNYPSHISLHEKENQQRVKPAENAVAEFLSAGNEGKRLTVF